MDERSRVLGIARFGLTARNARRLVEFYTTAFGGRRLSQDRAEGAAFRRLMDVEGGAERHRLALGAQVIEILEFDVPGHAEPPDPSPANLAFQHFALVVSDMRSALERLAQTGGWTAITRNGPQHLPQRSGGVTAYKFRDPDGHPLEFLQFPPHGVPPHWRACMAGGGVCGIDHSAISVADTDRSSAFYQALGFTQTGHSANQGIEQAHLDGVPSPQVGVTALAPACATPHVELLNYRTPARPAHAHLHCNDVAATRLVLEVASPTAPAGLLDGMRFDPDGHRLEFVAGSLAAADQPVFPGGTVRR